MCTIKSLDQYIIGFTVLSADKKGDSYRRREQGFHHFVVLSDKMDRPTALALEGALQDAIMSNPSDIVYKKYHKEKIKNGKIYSSYGGSPRKASTKDRSVYMVWFER